VGFVVHKNVVMLVMKVLWFMPYLLWLTSPSKECGTSCETFVETPPSNDATPHNMNKDCAADIDIDILW